MAGSKTWCYFPLFCLITTQFSLSISQQINFTHYFCMKNTGNYTQNSTYQTNLNSLLSSLSANINSFGFYNASLGQEPDRVSATVLCRGDIVDPQTCRECVDNSVKKLVQACPNQKEAIGWYDRCMLRYSNESIIGILDTAPSFSLASPLISSNVGLFDQEIRRLARDLENEAPWGSGRKFATEKSNNSDIETIYALMQCVPDIDVGDCNLCLRGAADLMSRCCSGRQGARVIGPSCIFWYELFSFYNVSGNQSPPPKGKNGNKTTTAIVVCAVLGSLLVLLSACIFIFRRRRRIRRSKNGNKLVIEDTDGIDTVETVQYEFGKIQAATDNFSNANLLGRGGFGSVYKGIMLDEKIVAVKRLSHDSRQGELEFRNEVVLMAKLQHKSLVRLWGFCVEDTERILIYEFMSNGSLDRFIFDPIRSSHLNWNLRYKVIENVARGLLYLHEDSRLKIIHRDLKASNILLDEDMNAKISDFGMAKLFQLDESVANTNKVVGTYGYMAPEYALHGLFSDKSDVFSYGVLVLEIISGKKNVYFRDGQNVEDLLSYAWKSWLQEKALDIIDPTLKECDSSSNYDILKCIHVGLLCVQDNVASRPNMASIVLMLHSFTTTLPIPSEPAYLSHSRSISANQSPLEDMVMRNSGQAFSVNAHNQSFNETSITDLYPR